MTVENSAQTADPEPAPGPPARPEPTAHTALDRYNARLRPWRIGYAAAIVVAVAIALIIVRVAWTHGEIAHTTLRSVPSAPASIALQSPSSAVTQAWTSTDPTAIGTPYWDGTIVTHDAHTVRGRNATTGAQTWSFTRSDRTMCTTIQIGGVTVAVYRLAGNCDEVDAMNSGTGAREWDRTLDEDGHPINGTPSFATQSQVVLISDSSVIYAIDPASGEDRWLFAEQGCTITGTAFGTSGALISQNCVNRDCTNLKFCRQGPQLLLRDLYAGTNTNTKTNGGNPDQIKWNAAVPATERPASADGTVSALDPGGELEVLNAGNGHATGQIALDSDAVAPVSAVAAGQSELLWTNGVSYGISDQHTLLWHASTPAPVTATTAPGFSAPDLDTALLAVALPPGIVLIDGSTGTVSRRFPVTAPPAGSLVYPFSSGFVVAGPSTTVYR